MPQVVSAIFFDQGAEKIKEYGRDNLWHGDSID